MPSIANLLLITTLVCLSPKLLAATIHRCEAPDGRITFTTMSCKADESLSLQPVQPFTPGTTISVMPEASARLASSMNEKKREPTVVGQSEDKCGNLINAKQRREAIINQRVIAGMSQQDVESALGKPDKISIRNSATSYRYDLKRGRSAHVEFDERGCVKGKAKSQTAKSPR
ncbi:cell envelope protein SmpA [Pseudomonas frederiksbergensis]|uniref:Cell envelope protein SmpA n=1 Tax=Pseudomonas frederiksbergensis TaxID=104087 RepID=A0A423KIV8_9PSED|nr:cell envelope protein SmpA [Pseudomonas frederiksbergensis]RON53085.1 cell envelope protein SmpA [Pseudomonas frederiksbergensis]